MLFFDDDKDNIKTALNLDIPAYLVDYNTGVTLPIIKNILSLKTDTYSKIKSEGL
jgi:hypothetical protein